MGTLYPCCTPGSHLQHERAEECPVDSATGAGDTRSAKELHTHSSITRQVGGQRTPHGAPPRTYPSKQGRENPTWCVGFSRLLTSFSCSDPVRRVLVCYGHALT